MNVKRIICAACLLLLILISNGNITALAMNTGFETESMTEERKESLWPKFMLELSDYKEESNKISCFDVSESGLIAIGFEYSWETKKVINIYNSDGRFLYGYLFDDYGTYGVAWNGENLLICIVRGDFEIMIDKSGSCLDIRKVSDTPNNNDHWNYLLHSKKRTVNGSEYRLVKGNNGYTKLIKTDSNGKKTTIYQADTEFYITKGDILWLLCFSLAIIGNVIPFIVKKRKKRGVYEDTGFNPYESSDKT